VGSGEPLAAVELVALLQDRVPSRNLPERGTRRAGEMFGAEFEDPGVTVNTLYMDDITGPRCP